MYIKKLSANKNTFNDIEFVNGRINLILGTKISKKKGKSTNGVGKTLSVKLIDFCLGADIKKNAENSELLKLDGWEFKLHTVFKNDTMEIVRSIDNKNEIFINGESYSLKDYKEIMDEKLFPYESKYKLSYRSLISRFIRMPLKGYVDWRFCKEKEEESVALISNSFFLGLNLDLIESKINIKSELNNLNTNKKIIINDENIKEIIKGKNIGVNISSLEKDLSKLEVEIDNFQISEGYNEIKYNLEKTKSEKIRLINEIVKIQNIIDNIDKSLEIEYDISSERVIKLYENAKLVLGDSVVKTINQVSELHRELLINRKLRLKKDKEKFIQNIDTIKKQIVIYDNRIDLDMEYLIGKGTIEEYNSLMTRVSDIKLKIQKLQEYDNIINGLEDKIIDRKLELAKQNVKSESYIKQDPIKKYSQRFKEYVDYIYDSEKLSGIVLENNKNENKIRFDLLPEIEGEKSAGINNVKIFCMDMLRIDMKTNNDVGFIYHDSTLFSEIDPRQVYFMLKLAQSICEKNNVQYIINLNYDIYDKIMEVIEIKNDYSFKKYLSTGIVKRLEDENVSDKLLGIQI
ncbi:MAG: DUF2326 domain-containing protein [Clostridium sp.]|uniref:DUF2326 domain-containing protein n=1 Tax=Clostridium sp. TaxID=1506 RepID=UPI003F379B44